MREKEGLKMGGKEKKRGACRGESLIICLPKKPHHNRVENTLNHKRVEEKKTKGAEVERMGWEGMREEKRDGENRDKRKDKGWTLPERY